MGGKQRATERRSDAATKGRWGGATKRRGDEATKRRSDEGEMGRSDEATRRGPGDWLFMWRGMGCVAVSCGVFLLCGAAQSVAAPSGADGGAATRSAAKATVELLADQAAVTPGRPLTLALRFQIEKGWHIYWRNAGVSGLPPSVKWKLPPGFEAGPLQFPAPKRYPSELGDSFILEGRPTLLVEMKVPAGLPAGEEVEIAGAVSWLVCKESCVREKQDVSLKLPVQTADAPPKPANEGAFRVARRFLPKPAAEAEYLKLSTAVSVDRIRPGDDAKVALVLDLKEGHHIQSNKPLGPGYVATEVFPDDVIGLTIGEAVFPPDKKRTIPEIGEVAEFAGRVVIVLPIKGNPDLKGPDVRVSGVLTYQACDEKTGQCFLPEHLEWSVTVPVAEAGAAVTPVSRDIFAGAATASRSASPQIGATAGGFTLDRAIDVRREEAQHPLWLWLLLALVAGLVLNVTPCVLPVISIKVLSFVQQAQESPARVLKLGLAFAAGMMIVFNILAGLAVFAAMVWGQHFQSPTFVLVMTAIIFALALSLFGVFTLGVPRTIEEAASRQEREGYAGSLAKGALATALGTPCLGPVLGSVLTWAVAQPAPVVFLVFNTIGLGMAAPYIALTANPRWLRFVPKPGPWMETFKHVMGFILMATVVYLVGITQGQSGGAATVWALAFLVCVAFACWLWGRYVSLDSTAGARAGVRIAALSIVAIGWYVLIERTGATNVVVGGRGVTAAATQPSEAAHGRLPWQEFSLQRLEELTASGKTVMVDVTAEWCLNCKYNLKFVLDSDRVVARVRELDVVPLLADWTGYDEAIRRFIQKLAPGASVPLLAIFPAGRPQEPIVMLGIVTEDQVLRALAEAHAKTSG